MANAWWSWWWWRLYLCYEKRAEPDKSIEVIKEIEGFYEYELPKNLIGIIWKGKFRGQKQKWFIAKFIGDEKEINLNTQNPEFIDWKWVSPDELPKLIEKFKKNMYVSLLKAIKKIIGW